MPPWPSPGCCASRSPAGRTARRGSSTAAAARTSGRRRPGRAAPRAPKNTTRPMIGATSRPTRAHVVVMAGPRRGGGGAGPSRARRTRPSPPARAGEGRGSVIVSSASTRPGRPGHHHDPVGQHHGLGDRVGDEHDRDLALLTQAQEEVAHLGACDLVQGREGLVHQQHRRVEGEGADERDPLLHAAGQLVGVGVEEVAQAHLPQQRVDLPRRRGRCAAGPPWSAGGRWPGRSARAAARGTAGRSRAGGPSGPQPASGLRRSPCRCRSPPARRSPATGWSCRTRRAR